MTKCHELKFPAKDGKKYLGDAGNTETILRIIQSIPSPRAEPLKQRLASLGNERYHEMNDPEL
ncbi:MAG: phage antirepressor [Candidatus Peribacteria bacterium]|nr:phage antirepressor [Candidatus Peribacteria bacterium]